MFCKLYFSKTWSALSVVPHFKTTFFIHSAFDRLLEFVNNPFSSAILFTTEFDLTYKLNKKKTVSIIDKAPTFGNANEILLEYLAK